ncbi:biopolymer transporter ExbB [Novimethylophilus kurashikiensis]|uniref:Biopolymer transport protein ExbB n=1 Tax=Novimethylophilus kurashikiensis TaxID=1825523 RepID=A0A2R5FBV9_9PROT|nr:MotA/TolQ/ExbB proton channel family protein [Novimethylophilus kurashikiensis]GBG14393.1 biopolymer transporter ExbB [Novimethylophilus kurashikiensis]
MIGNIIQYTLYAIFWLTVTLAVGGGFIAAAARKARNPAIVDPWLAGLALIAATSPYVGLFGTVWHIIQALSGIGSGNLNVAAIAHPIGEALYATLWGLGCAIPALIAHRVILMVLPEEPVAVAPEEAASSTQE